jgi:hypothetical protein
VMEIFSALCIGGFPDGRYDKIRPLPLCRSRAVGVRKGHLSDGSGCLTQPGGRPPTWHTVLQPEHRMLAEKYDAGADGHARNDDRLGERPGAAQRYGLALS